MKNYNFWCGEKVRLRAVEPSDWEALAASTEGPDSEIDRLENQIGFPVSKLKDGENLRELAIQERKDDSCFLLIETVAGQWVGFIGTFDVERRHGTFKYWSL